MAVSPDHRGGGNPAYGEHFLRLFPSCQQRSLISGTVCRNSCEVGKDLSSRPRWRGHGTSSKPPTSEPPSGELSKMRTCDLTRNPGSSLIWCARPPVRAPCRWLCFVHFAVRYPTRCIFILSPGRPEASVKQRWCKQYYCTFQRTIYYKIKKCLFFPRLFFMCHLCEKFYKPITVLYCIADCVSWVPRLTLLDLTNKLGLLPNALFVCRGLTVFNITNCDSSVSSFSRKLFLPDVFPQNRVKPMFVTCLRGSYRLTQT